MTPPRDVYQALPPPPRRSWWADRDAQRERAVFVARLQRELPRISASREGQRWLNSGFIIGRVRP